MNERRVAFVLLAVCVLALGASAGALSTDLFPDASEDDGPGGGSVGEQPAPPSVDGEQLPVSAAPWLVSLAILAGVLVAGVAGAESGLLLVGVAVLVSALEP
jgi:hypothetical protein